MESIADVDNEICPKVADDCSDVVEGNFASSSACVIETSETQSMKMPNFYVPSQVDSSKSGRKTGGRGARQTSLSGNSRNSKTVLADSSTSGCAATQALCKADGSAGTEDHFQTGGVDARDRPEVAASANAVDKREYVSPEPTHANSFRTRLHENDDANGVVSAEDEACQQPGSRVNLWPSKSCGRDENIRDQDNADVALNEAGRGITLLSRLSSRSKDSREETTGSSDSNSDHEASYSVSDGDDETLIAPRIGSSDQSRFHCQPVQSDKYVCMRRSTRSVSEPDRFVPGRHPFCNRTESVFAKYTDQKFSNTRKLLTTADFLRAQNFRRQREEEISNLRKEIDCNDAQVKPADENERNFAEMAEEEQNEHLCFISSLVKYECPQPFFSKLARRAPVERCEWKFSAHDYLLHPLLDILQNSRKLSLGRGQGEDDVDFGELFSVDLIAWSFEETRSEENQGDSLEGVVEVLFQETVYDDTAVDGRCERRRQLFSALLRIISVSKYASKYLPSLTEVLSNFGADVDDDDDDDDVVRRGRIEQQMFSIQSDDERAIRVNHLAEGSLDYDAVVSHDGGRDHGTLAASRNLRRALRVYKQAVENGMDLCRLAGTSPPLNENSGTICASTDSANDSSQEAGDDHHALFIVTVCARLMVSPFGSQLSQEAGALIVSVLDRVGESEWPKFRLKVCEQLVLAIYRLGLQVELVTYLFPYLSRRSRLLSLDLTYYYAKLWHRGPQGLDKAVLPELHQVSISAQQLGTESVSFTLTDVVELMSNIPEPSKNTDVYWARGLMRLLKQVVADDDVLCRRGDGDLERLMGLAKKMRKFAKRMGDGVAVQDVRIALESLRHVVERYAVRVRQSRESDAHHDAAFFEQPTMADTRQFR